METQEVPQWRVHLDRGNEVRLHRADLKRRLKAGEVDLIVVLEDPKCATMHIYDALMALPGVGRTKVSKVLRDLKIGPTRECGQLTYRQRLALSLWISRRAR